MTSFRLRENFRKGRKNAARSSAQRASGHDPALPHQRENSRSQQGRQSTAPLPRSRHDALDGGETGTGLTPSGTTTLPTTAICIVQSHEDEDLSRSALATFYREKINEKINNAPPSGPLSRWTYVGTTASNLAHLVHSRTTRPECLHYPFPNYRATLPWKPFTSSSSTHAVPVNRGQDSSAAHAPPQWTFAPPSDPDLAVLPVSEIRAELINAYFEHIHPGFPIIQESDFRNRLEQGISNVGSPANGNVLKQEPPALLLIQCVLLAGVHVSMHPRVRHVRASIKQALYRRVRTLFDMHHENDRLNLIQAALILTWHVDSADDISANGWYWSGVASRIALGLGLHRRMASVEMSIRDQRRLRTLWWMVAQTEIMFAFSHGRPVSFDLDDCDQAMLTKKDLQEEYFDSETGTSHEACTADVDFCLANTSLCFLIWEILKLHSPGWKRRLGGEDSSAMRAAKRELNDRLAKWCMQLPSALGQPGHPSQSSLATQLHLHYYAAIITLNRRLPASIPEPDPGYGPGFWMKQASCPLSAVADLRSPCDDGLPTGNHFEGQWLSLCHSSALSIVSILNRMVDSGWSKSCWPSTLTSILAAATVFSSEIRTATSPLQSPGNDATSAGTWSADRVESRLRGQNSGSSSNLLMALESFHKLQALASLSNALIPYWSSADGLCRLLELILAELKVLLNTVASISVDLADCNSNATPEHHQPRTSSENGTRENITTFSHAADVAVEPPRWNQRSPALSQAQSNTRQRPWTGNVTQLSESTRALRATPNASITPADYGGTGDAARTRRRTGRGFSPHHTGLPPQQGDTLLNEFNGLRPSGHVNNGSGYDKVGGSLDTVALHHMDDVSGTSNSHAGHGDAHISDISGIWDAESYPSNAPLGLAPGMEKSGVRNSAEDFTMSDYPGSLGADAPAYLHRQHGSQRPQEPQVSTEQVDGFAGFLDPMNHTRSDWEVQVEHLLSCMIDPEAVRL
ncbi:uncharacterized protein Z520_10252 [Fonsecaea multimorphosa CBS 102226]|uniref:Xylanolytic transcriptional activator regulatory domain-containing protein n=1 Tax=Fonsecaea multimorphosa CBS 102226 TaxID=1442371 RepID=A0A0D2GWF7_9EURO|nr:uncharacterized protein Z520_10252 [Fonsecaea multimorphosa CBS 102226]KIX93915.1 hypothetical protein Z520_10252 [Fonsecaea multimorphosa CBS 102226]